MVAGNRGAPQRQTATLVWANGHETVGVDPFYMRYFAKADLTIIGEDKTVHESGNMIYEFNYMGKSDPRAHLK